MKQFFKMFFASLLAISCVFVGGLLLLAIFIGGLASLSDPQPKVQSGSVLTFDMSVNIQDAPVSVTQAEIINEVLRGTGLRTLALRDVLGGIRAAAEDERIEALHLKGSFDSRGYGSGFAALKEVRMAIEDFKQSGKPVIAYLVYPTTKDMYVAALADHIVMNPEGMIVSPGMASTPIFFKGFFDKYGIGVQVTKAGEFKSAAESFVLQEMSEPARKQTADLLEDLWSEYLQAVTQRAGIEPADYQSLLDEKLLLTADVALEAGIVDQLGFADTVLDRLRSLSKPAEEKYEIRGIELGQYAKAIRSGVSGSHIAIIYAEGAIVDGEGAVGQVGGDRIAREIRKVRMDEKVKAIVLRVNSPGGSALASEVIQHELSLAQKTLPVVVSMGTVAASGGYWISAYGDRIFAEPTTITGSIGVIGMFLNFAELAATHGFTFDVVKTSKFADVMSPARPKTEEEMALVQGEVDEVYDAFLRKVSEGRGLDVERVREIASGRVWSGIDALEIGLVDEMGGLDAAVAHAAELAELGANPKVRDYPEPIDFFQELIKGFSAEATAGPVSEAKRAFDGVLAELKWLAAFDDPRGVYALLPFRFDIK